MECLAGVGALSAGGAKATFEYNRENFMYDRRLRRRKAFKVMEFKIAQAKLWREDIRDLCSLTEYKMHVYLLVNVLLLGHTIVLWCQGKLPHKTPDWLMAGYAIATAGAGMFLLLSIWMAMHAAVSAQSYEARLLTQLVRLPIPSWNEVEACRTYGSEFEKLEAKQMFRVPFVMGAQESLVSDPAASSQASTLAAAPEDMPATDQGFGRQISDESGGHGFGRQISEQSAYSSVSGYEGPSSARSRTRREGRAQEEPAASARPAVSDPWGLERNDADIDELGCKLGSEVAQLRHVKLARQAMVHWQSYDAFARISMSVGVDQLLLAMSYYILGYMLVEVGCRSAAAYGVVLLTVLSVTLLRLDMSLDNLQLRLLQGLLAMGPICSTLACLQWSDKSQHNMKVAEALLVVAFLAHGTFIAVLSHLANISDSEGVALPMSFHSVLYLDVFGYVKQGPPGRGQEVAQRRGSQNFPIGRGGFGATPYSDNPLPDQERPDDALPRVAEEALDEQDDSFERGWGHEVTRDPTLIQQEEVGTSHAALPRDSIRAERGTIRYDDESGRPRALRPDDFQPTGFVDDLRALPGAPNVDHALPPNESAVDPQNLRFYNANSWMRKAAGPDDDEGLSAPIVTGHEGTNPMSLPPQIFTAAMRTLALAWLIAGVYYGISVSTGRNLHTQVKYKVAPSSNASASGASLLSFGSSIGAQRGLLYDITLQQMNVSWPFSDLEPRTLACDASGSHFVASDGLLMFSSKLSEEAAPGWEHLGSSARLSFAEAPPCAHVEGEGIQDMAVACESTEDEERNCEALVLHRHGRRVAACALSQLQDGASSGDTFVANVSDVWLNRLREVTPSSGRSGPMAPHARVEKVVAVASEPDCGECTSLSDRWRRCTVLGTTHNRVVQVREQPVLGDLIPSEVLLQGTGVSQVVSGRVRPLQPERLGVLLPDGHAISVLDSGGGQIATLEFSEDVSMAGFCTGGGFLYMMRTGPSPSMWRAPIPPEH